MLTPIVLLWSFVKDHVRRLREDEGGYTTETVLVTAALVALALVVIALLVKVVTDKANSIHM
ncbi:MULTISPECIES: hypothetical protein [Amycolatopsis]|uniref:Uncharacterized protein n=1 Tax=Amycolatopsis echigonensis TaxID=2576905 RepID=A0A2N3WLM6_9PSEU|nr:MULTISPECIES: hypothetical protein [Amycolatopsis]MBB2500742.1 hypothetical protein [Amycolatopsis echigonensis]MCG3751300.1 hypothetical protein [Amycolatopsis sp. Poz14]PKV94765.1 hypothetical protein ATK30_5650 [Amycolatopsis niigatensis]